MIRNTLFISYSHVHCTQHQYNDLKDQTSQLIQNIGAVKPAYNRTTRNLQFFFLAGRFHL